MASHTQIVHNVLIENGWEITDLGGHELRARRPGYLAKATFDDRLKLFKGEVRSEDGATGQFSYTLADYLELVAR